MAPGTKPNAAANVILSEAPRKLSGRDLYLELRAQLLRDGRTFKDWCDEIEESENSAKLAILDVTRSPRADEIRAKAQRAVNAASAPPAAPATS